MPYFACDEEYLKTNYTSFFLSFGKPLSLDDIMSIDGNKMIVNIKGVLTNAKYDLLIDAFELAKDDGIKKVDLQIDSPGGVVGNVDLVWTKAFELKGNKEINAYVNGMMASAAYWIGSIADRIIANNPLSIIGSIGVYYSEIDFTQYDQMNGIKEIVLRSSNAKYKNLSASDETGRDEIQERLDVIENQMLTRIATGRNVSKRNIIDNYGQGKSFIAKSIDKVYVDALQRGLVDKVLNSKINYNNKTKTEEKVTMYKSLKDAYAEHPELEFFVKQERQMERASAIEDTKQEYSRLAGYIESESYSDHIKGMVAKFLKGEYTSLETIDAAIATMDYVNASRDVASVASANDQTDSTVSDTDIANQRSDDGVVRNEEDYNATLDEMRKIARFK